MNMLIKQILSSSADRTSPRSAVIGFCDLYGHMVGRQQCSVYLKRKCRGQGDNMFQETQTSIKIQSWSGAALMSTQPDRNINCGYRKHHLCV